MWLETSTLNAERCSRTHRASRVAAPARNCQRKLHQMPRAIRKKWRTNQCKILRHESNFVVFNENDWHFVVMIYRWLSQYAKAFAQGFIFGLPVCITFVDNVCGIARVHGISMQVRKIAPCRHASPGDCKSAARTPALGQGLFFIVWAGVSGPYYDQRAL